MNWLVKRVKEVAELAIGPFGSALKTDSYVSEGLPVVAGGNLGGGRWPDVSQAPRVSPETASRLARSVALPGDLIFPHRGSIGRVGIANRELMLSTSMMRARFNPSVVDSEFAYWFFLAEGSRELLTMASSVGTPGIGQPLTSLGSVRIRMPDLPTQEAVRQVLGAIDDKIVANGNVAKALLRLGEASVRKSPLNRRKLSDVADVTMGSSPKGEFLNEDGIGMSFYQGVRDFGTVFPTPRVSTTSPVRTAPAASTLLAVRAPVGTVNLATEAVCIGRGLASIASKERPATLHFCLRAFQEVWDEHQGSGTVFASVNGRDVRETRLAMPEVLEERLEHRLASLLKRAVQAEQESVYLTATRDELLPLLMSGKITVKDAEKTVEEVV